jgi:hypothetical protein
MLTASLFGSPPLVRKVTSSSLTYKVQQNKNKKPNAKVFVVVHCINPFQVCNSIPYKKNKQKTKTIFF